MMTVVAMNSDMVSANLDEWCGKEYVSLAQHDAGLRAQMLMGAVIEWYSSTLTETKSPSPKARSSSGTRATPAPQAV